MTIYMIDLDTYSVHCRKLKTRPISPYREEYKPKRKISVPVSYMEKLNRGSTLKRVHSISTSQPTKFHQSDSSDLEIKRDPPAQSFTIDSTVSSFVIQ